MRAPLRPAAAGLAAAALVLAGCRSGDGKSADPSKTCVPVTAGAVATPTAPVPTGALSTLTAAELARRAKAELLRASSVRIAGAIAAPGGGAGFRIDMGYSAAGAQGTVSNRGNDFALAAVGATVWFKAPGPFWKGLFPADVEGVRAVSGKWLRGTSCNKGIKDYAGYVSRVNFVESLFANAENVTYGERKTIDGVDCAGLRDDSGTLYVAIADARPVRLVGPEGKPNASDTIAFTQYGQVAAPVPPPDEQTVEPSVFR